MAAWQQYDAKTLRKAIEKQRKAMLAAAKELNFDVAAHLPSGFKVNHCMQAHILIISVLLGTAGLFQTSSAHQETGEVEVRQIAAFLLALLAGVGLAVDQSFIRLHLAGDKGPQHMLVAGQAHIQLHFIQIHAHKLRINHIRKIF